MVTSSIAVAEFAELTLHIGTTQFAVADATVTGSQAVWTNSGLSWSDDQMITVKLTAPTQSSNANLTSLTGTTSTDGSTFGGTLGISGFDGDTTAYTVSVANSVTHVKLTPTKAHTAATIKVGKRGTTLATVASTESSAAIALSVGANNIDVEVTPESGAAGKKTYTVTVTRAAAQGTLPAGTVWQATLTAGIVGGSFPGFGCSGRSDCDSKLTNNSITAGGKAYRLVTINDVTSGSLANSLIISFQGISGSGTPNAALKLLNFCVGTTAFAMSGAGGPTVSWSNANLPWSDGGTVSLSIGSSCAGGTPPTQSSDASLTSLTGTTSTDGSTFSGTLGISGFDKATTSYTVNVATDVTHVKLTPTKAHTGASIKVGKGTSLTTVTSGSASTAIALGAAGSSTALKVEVTAEDGTKQTYTVTVARAAAGTPPTPVVEFKSATYSATETDVRYSAQNFVSVKASVSPVLPADTNIKLSIVSGATATKAAGNCTSAGDDYFFDVAAWAVTSMNLAEATAPVTICGDTVSEPTESFTLRILPGTGYVVGSQSETVVTILDNDPPGAPSNLWVRPGNTRLDLSWTAPANDGGLPITGYHVHYTSSTTVAADAAVGTSVASAWVAVSRSGTTPSQAIASLTNGTPYRVRVRATNAGAVGASAWVTGTGTPVAVLPPGRVVAMRVIADRITSWRGESGQLRVYWQGTRGGGAHDGFEVQYTASGTVANDAAAGTDRDTGWVDAGGGKGCCWKGWMQRISVPLDKQYRVRVRAVHLGRNLAGPWSYDRRSLGAMRLRADFNPRYFGVAEGSSVTLTVDLTHAAPAGGMKMSIAVTGVTGGTATPGADYRLNRAPDRADRTSVNFDIPAGKWRGTATLYILDDEEPEGNETIELRAHQRVQRVVPSSNRLTLVIGANDGHPSDSAMKILRMNAAGNSPEDVIVLDPPFDPSTANYRASVSNRVESLRFSASTSNPQARLTVNGGPADAPVALKEGANRVDVKVTSADTQNQRTYTVTVNRAAAEERPEPPKTPLTAAFEGVPGEHDGKKGFDLLVRFSEALGSGGKAPAAKSFAVRQGQGKVKAVERIEAGLWRVRIKPASWRDIAVTLAGGRSCDTAGAVCAADGRSLSNTVKASIGGPVRIRVKDGKAREGKDESLDFAVSLNRAASDRVSVDYATADGTATAGEDYTATAGTLVFAPGEKAAHSTKVLI